MANWIRTGDPRGFDKGSRVRQTPEEGRRIYRPKHCGNNNKDEDNSPKTLNDKNQRASSQKFKQVCRDLSCIASRICSKHSCGLPPKLSRWQCRRSFINCFHPLNRISTKMVKIDLVPSAFFPYWIYWLSLLICCICSWESYFLILIVILFLI